MMDVLNSGIGVIIILGIMVFIHEWGHFIAARLFGVRVEVFSFGMGPRLWGRKRGDTDYRLSALPLGGYVKMAGDDASQEREGRADEFLSKPRWQRAIVILAGPTMNLALAVVLTAGIFMGGVPQPVYLDQPAEIAGVIKGSVAERAGLRAGDRIIEVNKDQDPKWEQVLFEALAAAGSDVRIVIDRNGARLPMSIPTSDVKRESDAFSLLGYPKEPALVRSVSPGTSADVGGLKADDRIIELNGQPVLSPEQFKYKIQEIGASRADLLVQRGERQLHIQVQPAFSDPGDGGGARYLIGFAFRSATVSRHVSALQAVQLSVTSNYRFGKQIVWVVGQLVQAKLSIKQLGGPLEIARQSGQAVKSGAVAFVSLMAILSLNLGILNLLPIPILDGGHILMLLIEGTLRRELSVAFKERFVQVGLVFLLFIIVVVTFNDILKLPLFR